MESTTLRAFAYDDGREVLQLEFVSGAIYHYSTPAFLRQCMKDCWALLPKAATSIG